MYGGKIRAEGTCEELLTQEHTTILETADMPDGVIAEVRGVLARHDLTLTRVEHPRRSLESLFLEIVEQATADGTRTAGVTAGGPVASFLSADEAAATVNTGLLNSLTNR